MMPELVGVLILKPARSGASSAVVAKKKVYFTDAVRFNGQDPVSRTGKATGRRAFEMQSAQSVSAAYYFDPATRDYTLAAGAIELVVEGVPFSAFIEPSQSGDLIFCARLDRLPRRKHAGDGGKFRRDLQAQNAHAMKGRERKLSIVDSIGRSTFGGGRKASRNLRTTIKIAIRR
jgi:hypothetical protein